MNETLKAAAPIVVALITGVFGLLGSLIAVFKDELREWLKSREKPVETDAKEVLVSANLRHTPPLRNTESRRRPFNSRIEILQSSAGKGLVFRIPIARKEWFSILFTAGWLIGWTASIVFTAYSFFGKLFGSIRTGTTGEDIFGIVFMGGWLIGALAGEVVVAGILKNSLVSAFENAIEVRFSSGELILLRRRGRISSERRYPLDKVDGFEAYGTSGVGEVAGVFFRFGIDRVSIDGLTPNEAEWLAQELEYASQVENEGTTSMSASQHDA